jgi:hypothetical protein
MPWVRALASTGRARRAFLRAAALVPFAALGPSRASATDYGSAGEALDALDQLQADVEGRLRALVRARPAAGALVASLLADHARQAADRGRLRRRLRLPSAGSPDASARETSLGQTGDAPVGQTEGRSLGPTGGAPRSDGGRSLQALRDAQQALVYAHAEGLPALGDRRAVDLLAAHMVELARHLTVLDLWREAEEALG